MKTRNLLITLSVAALAAVNVMAADAVLSPRAKDNQSKIVSGTNTDPNHTTQALVATSPRLLDNQIKIVAGQNSDVNIAMQCTRMAGTPKMIGACAEHPGAAMSCCSVAETK
jgi:hypothetical protein